MKKYLMLLMLVMMITAVASDQSKSIDLTLTYQSETPWDTDNDGVESYNGVVDLSVEQTSFGWDANEAHLCTEWRVEEVLGSMLQESCHGSVECCHFIDLISSEDKWDAPLQVDRHTGGLADNKRVHARVLFVDFSLDPQNIYTDIVQSNWDYQYAVFSQKSVASLETVNVQVSSPQTTLSSGEDVFLNFTTNVSTAPTVHVNTQSISLASAQSFATQINGSLPNQVFANGAHSAVIELPSLGNHTFNFTVSDSTPPSLSGPWDEQGNATASTNTLMINVSSSEYGSLKYHINNGVESSTSLDEKKQASIQVNVINGSNSLFLNVSDHQNNSNDSTIVFDFSPNPSCNDGVQNGNETGLDCGGSCGSCTPFTVTLEKTTFNQTEPVKVSIQSRASSHVHLNISKDGLTKHSEIITSVFPGSSIFVVKTISLTEAGTYSLNATSFYAYNQEVHSQTFTKTQTINPLSVSISANDTTIKEGEEVKFTASISGNTSAPSAISWNFGDGSTSSDTHPTHDFSSNGTHTVNLSVTWDGWVNSDTQTINVEKVVEVTVLVKDENGAVIEGADVELGSLSNVTDSAGRYTFKTTPGTYSLVAIKSGYSTYSNTTTISESTTREVVLTKTQIDDTTDPEVSVSGPSNGATVEGNEVVLTYSVNDSSKVNCTVFLKNSEGWWEEQTNAYEISSDADRTFTLQNLESKQHEWKIDCIDEFGNEHSSGASTFTIGEGAQEQETEQDPEIEELTIQIDAFKSELANLEGKELQAATAMNLEKVLEDAKTQLTRSKRDLHNLVWRRLNASGVEKERNVILSRIDEIKRSTPKKITVADTSDFVSYPTNEEVENISLSLLDTNPKRSVKNAYVSHNQELQKDIQVTTKSHHLDVEYLSGNNGKITIVEKVIEIHKNHSDASIIEVIPKEIAKNISDVVADFDYAIIEEDPIIQINFPIEEYSYFVRKEVASELVKDTKTILIVDDVSQVPPITGFAILGELPSRLVETSKIRLIIEILIILSLVVVYISLTGGFRKAKYMLHNREALKQEHHIKTWLKQTTSSLQNNNYDKAKELYTKSIVPTFRGLPPEMRKEMYDKITKVSHKIDAYHINKLLDKAFFSVEAGHKETALPIYKQVSQLYKRVGPDFKASVLKRCNELHDKLQK